MLSFLSHQGKNFQHLTKIMQIDSFVLFDCVKRQLRWVYFKTVIIFL